ncbi:LacI family transcriptional regulator [Nonomuraea sp. NBC_01738]|uniref:LacI family DNA-binding transcriptional regulator n=1 Tax=Nonomuraea sp. NBC_01738 TaxID=2976003 RepID=UPI002E1076D7|nr:LacI family transcriptional regulator [Nonomuraea sp. NBC_01738]
MKRPTIADIARRAGVTKSAVSFALNDRGGVSAETRRRILEIADELGWQRSSAASALSHGRAGAVGLVVDRPARTLDQEPYFMQFISGVESELSARDVPLLLQMTADQEAQIAAHRRWWAERRVDGVILVDLCVDDPRPAAITEMGLPAVVAGGPDGLGGLPGVWDDEEAAMRAVVGYLRALGHTRLARVAGLRHLMHTVVRDRAFEGTVEYTDYSGEAGAKATRALLTGPGERPTAIVYDNDVMAVAGLGVARELGIHVPGELSLVAWDDSTLTRLAHPALTAVSVDIFDRGVRTARRLLDVIAGGNQETGPPAVPELVPRGSTEPV